MIVIDEYLLVRVVLGQWPVDVPDSEELILPLSRHWRLLQALHGPGTGQLSAVLASLTPSGREAIRFPHPELVQVLDARVLLDEAAQISARWGGGGSSPKPLRPVPITDALSGSVARAISAG
jgi:hypothetical protein